MPDPIQKIIAETAALGTALEESRARYFQVFSMLAPMSFAAICAIAAVQTDHGTFAWLPVLIFTFMAVVIEFQIFNALYRKKAKAAFLNRIAAALGLRYEKNGVFPLEEMAAHKIIPPHDVRHIEDGFAGTVNGVKLAFQEVRLADRVRDERRQVREEQVFHGLVIRIGIGKVLDAHTVVLPRNATLTFFRRLFTHFETVRLVSPKFEERFDVLSTSQVEARYILDPAFMERLLAAGDLIGTKWIEVSFLGQEIAFAIQRNRPLFEIGALWSRLTAAHLQAVADELDMVIRLIDTLKLNPHTGLGAALPPKGPADR